MITIVDYGMGNLGSILNMFKRIGTKIEIQSDLNEITKAKKIILPGVGAFDTAMQRINDSGLRGILDKKVLQEKIPVMGICLGMQLLFETSEEGDCYGLGWIKGDVVRFNFIEENEKLNIPHMGWNVVNIKKESPLINNLYKENKYYFVHSYHAQCKVNEDVLMTTNYGYEFVSGIENENIFGFQFHPEKSHKYGKKIFENFINL